MEFTYCSKHPQIPLIEAEGVLIRRGDEREILPEKGLICATCMMEKYFPDKPEEVETNAAGR